MNADKVYKFVHDRVFRPQFRFWMNFSQGPDIGMNEMKDIAAKPLFFILAVLWAMLFLNNFVYNPLLGDQQPQRK
jgi:hypothetical protein